MLRGLGDNRPFMLIRFDGKWTLRFTPSVKVLYTTWQCFTQSYCDVRGRHTRCHERHVLVLSERLQEPSGVQHLAQRRLYEQTVFPDFLFFYQMQKKLRGAEIDSGRVSHCKPLRYLKSSGPWPRLDHHHGICCALWQRKLYLFGRKRVRQHQSHLPARRSR